ncbi:aminotransferase class V-fold PLP-dependent enzyme [Qingshengfaniella alkalisoli]|uniref:Aminotransferase class V-fold PLP-dependent enzyme n=1 Tax=Qingshengfaniella alkalisoli TaxID=2599296 RepID=A0A5B8JB69_9RHOB|nr:aminotransferase class V-fold PLP-dependent enzyme [Qingshengfaniella alkalisoli]QDY71527.1 aminotransferase class V-fold PLP-dependent enzyme [Qingshengfaniella alkalisoli]
MTQATRSRLLQDFRHSIIGGGLAGLQAGLIGDGTPVEGPFGIHPLLYADYVASGRALRQVEGFVAERLLPYYANSHTEASYCGATMTRTRQEARQIIADHVGADACHAVVFAGSGATAGINRLVHLTGAAQAVRDRARVVVLIGPYEHHSNILPWRECGAEVIEIDEAENGGPDLDHLRSVCAATHDAELRIGTFSAGSNVTGILTDTDAVTSILRENGIVSIWDYAGAGPYVSIDMRTGTAYEKDAVVFSPHKFIGGPAASGVLVVRRDIQGNLTPSVTGGGTVRFVSPYGHDYSTDLVAREEAGTPNVLGDLRAAMAVIVKEAIGQSYMDRRHAELRQRALDIWAANRSIELLGKTTKDQLPIFSFRVRNTRDGGFIHQQLFTRMLSDCYGIQARGGCACAGPYAHRLLGIGKAQSDRMRAEILAGHETEKPGWTRLNFSALLTDDKGDRIIAAVDELARNPFPMADQYRCDPATARFAPSPLAEAG